MKIFLNTKKNNKHIIYYALLFIVCFVLFYSIFLFQLKAENALLNITNKLQRSGVHIKNAEIHWLSRQIEISGITIQQENKHINLDNIRVKIHPLSKKITFYTNIMQNGLQGEAEGSITLSKLFNPKKANTQFSFKNIQAKYIFGMLNTEQFVEIIDGNISGNGTVMTPIVQNNVQIYASQGNLNLQISDTTANHVVPFFKESTITDLKGTIKLDWTKLNLNINVLQIDCPLFQIELIGVVNINRNQLLKSRIDSHATVTVDLTKMHEKFVPKRTLKSLKENGKVEMKIRNTLESPRVNIQ